MTDEIRQDGKVVLSSEDGFSIPMFFNNLCGKMEDHKGERMRLCFYACASFCTERKYCLGVMPYSCLNARKK